MTVLHAMLLGLVQGIAEFLPISSSGHLVLFQNLFGLETGGGGVIFEVLLHVGTLVSVLFFYWKDVKELILAFIDMVKDLFKGKFDINKTPARRFIGLLVIATVPLVIALIFKDSIEQAFSSTRFVGFALLVTGFILYLTDKIPNGHYDQSNLRYRNAFIVGCFQLFAILPGISRSGSTIFGGTFMGLSKKFAVKFSLLMSMIAILGAVVTSIPDMAGGALVGVSPLACIMGMIVSALSGIVAIKFLVKMLSNQKFKYFSYYCWAVGLISIIVSFVK